MGYVSSYIRVGSEAKKLDSSQFQFFLTVNNSSQDTLSTVKEKRSRKRKSSEGVIDCTSPEAQTKRTKRQSKRKETENSNTYDEIYDESEIYEPEVSESDESSDIVELDQRDRVASSAALKIQEDNSLKIQKAQVDCFNALKKARQSLCVKNQCQSASVATDVLLAKIAKEMPSTLTELAKVKGMAERQIISYGSDFLEIVNKFKKFQEGNK